MKACSYRDSDLNEWHNVFHPRIEPHQRRDVQLVHEMSAEEIAKHLGVSRQAVQQQLRSGISKCRRWCAEHGLRLEDLITIR